MRYGGCSQTDMASRTRETSVSRWADGMLDNCSRIDRGSSWDNGWAFGSDGMVSV